MRSLPLPRWLPAPEAPLGHGGSVPPAPDLLKFSNKSPSLVVCVRNPESSQKNVSTHLKSSLPSIRNPLACVTLEGRSGSREKSLGGRGAHKKRGTLLRMKALQPSPCTGAPPGLTALFSRKSLTERRLDNKGPFQPRPVIDQILGLNIFKILAPFPLSRGSSEPTCIHHPHLLPRNLQTWGHSETSLSHHFVSELGANNSFPSSPVEFKHQTASSDQEKPGRFYWGSKSRLNTDFENE